MFLGFHYEIIWESSCDAWGRPRDNIVVTSCIRRPDKSIQPFITLMCHDQSFAYITFDRIYILPLTYVFIN